MTVYDSKQNKRQKTHLYIYDLWSFDQLFDCLIVMLMLRCSQPWDKVFFNINHNSKGGKIVSVAEVLYQVELDIAKKLLGDQLEASEGDVKASELLKDDEKNTKFYFWGDISGLAQKK